MPSLADARRDYGRAGLSEEDVSPDPFVQLSRWIDDAIAAGVQEPNAMTLATADKAGRPSARTVLLKGVDARGLVFFTNYESRKGRELTENPRAALVIPWLELERQVCVVGDVERTSRLNFNQQRLEADFRHHMVRVREYSGCHRRSLGPVADRGRWRR